MSAGLLRVKKLLGCDTGRGYAPPVVVTIREDMIESVQPYYRAEDGRAQSFVVSGALIRTVSGESYAVEGDADAIVKQIWPMGTSHG